MVVWASFVRVVTHGMSLVAVWMAVFGCGYLRNVVWGVPGGRLWVGFRAEYRLRQFGWRFAGRLCRGAIGDGVCGDI